MATVRDTLRSTITALNYMPEPGRMVEALGWLRARHARLFIVGNGGGAGFALHAASDFRKIAGIDAYACDNLCEITARINDEGWDASLSDWLRYATQGDGLLVFSVGGGDPDGTSSNLARAVDEAERRGMKILGIVGQGGGYLSEKADACVVIPSMETPVVESCQAAVWHALVEALR